MDRETLTKELRRVATELRKVNARAEELYARRLELFLDARYLDPPMTYKELAEAAGCAPVAVSVALHKQRHTQSA